MWEQLVDKDVNWAKYHTIIIDNNNDNLKINLYKTIKTSKINKIIVANRFLIKSTLLLNIDTFIEVPSCCWFDDLFDDILEQVKSKINTNEINIIITCCGMGSCVLIGELLKKFPNEIYLDFGSALDIICTKKDTRGWQNINEYSHFNYDFFANLLKDCIPDNWEDNKYEKLYLEAKSTLQK
jgi:hypothetical protein